MSDTTHDKVVAEARSEQDLREKAKVEAPQLFKKLSEKPLVASKTVWGTAATMLVAWGVTKWGLDLDANEQEAVTDVAVMGVVAFLRYISVGSISGLVK